MLFKQQGLSTPPNQAVLARNEKLLKKKKKQNQQIFSPSAPTYLRRQSGFATERKYQTCATQENGSPALRLDDLGWSGEGEYV